MTKKSKNSQFFWENLKKFFPYLATFVIVIGIAFWGSLSKNYEGDSETSIRSLATNNYSATADQISEFYIVSELSSTMNLATAEAVNLNYNSLIALAETAQTTTEKFEKPTNIAGDCVFETGVVTYHVADGESMDSIVKRYSACGVTDTMIRWSNGFKNSVQVKAGDTILVPARAGFVYRVKDGDTIDGIAKKYKSNAVEIASSNGLDIDNPTLKVTAPILIPDGDLPETERPDYIAPVSNNPTYNYYYRLYWTSNNPMPWGWCTWYAWSRRAQMGADYILPGGLGNANTWDNSLSSTFYMDRNPQPGDVFQTDSGTYGHVGIVESVNGDGTITISDMNGPAGWGRVGTQTISNWHYMNFIHGRK